MKFLPDASPYLLSAPEPNLQCFRTAPGLVILVIEKREKREKREGEVKVPAGGETNAKLQ